MVIRPELNRPAQAVREHLDRGVSERRRTLTAANFSGALTGNETAAATLQTSRTINGVAFNGSTNIVVADSTKLPTSGGTLTGQLVSTRANDTANGGGQIFLNGSDSNRLDFGGVGVGPPSLAPRSVGTKITFYPECSASLVDYGMGVDAYTLWSSVPSPSSPFQFAWYGGTSVAATLSGTGSMSLAGGLTVQGATLFKPWAAFEARASTGTVSIQTSSGSNPITTTNVVRTAVGTCVASIPTHPTIFTPVVNTRCSDIDFRYATVRFVTPRPPRQGSW